MGSGGIVNSYINDKWICQLHALVALPPGKFPWYPLNWRLGGAESRCGHGRREKSLAPVRNRSTVARLPASVVLSQISDTRHSQKTITFILEVQCSNFGCVTDWHVSRGFHQSLQECKVSYCTSNEATISPSDILSNSLSANHSAVPRYILSNWYIHWITHNKSLRPIELFDIYKGNSRILKRATFPIWSHNKGSFTWSHNGLV
jgi:hypothetical protein